MFGDPIRYPIRHENPLYDLPTSGLSELLAMHARVGFARGLLVHPTIYLTDNALLVDSLAGLDGKAYRGVSLIDDATSDAELERLHAAGVRAARFHFIPRLGMVPDLRAFRRSLERIAACGWFAKVFATGDELETVAPELTRAPVPILLEHMCKVDFSLGLEQPAHKLILRLLTHDHIWIQLSNGDTSPRGPNAYPWRGAVPFGRAYYAAAPDRSVWGSDFPHVLYSYSGTPRRPLPDDRDLVRLLYEYLPDAAARENVLVNNPARLIGF